MATQDVLLRSTRSLEHQGNGISLIMVEFLNNIKNQPLGFRELGIDFLDISQIVSSLKVSLEEHFETKQPFPEQAIPELNRIVTKTSDDFDQLQRLLKKFMDFEKGGAFARLQKTWRMLFADKDIAKVHHSLQENKGALNMAMLLTNINPQGAAAHSYEYGLLAARLQQGPGSPVSALDASSSYAPSTWAPTVSSEDSDKIAIPDASQLTIDDGLIPVEYPPPPPIPPQPHYSPVGAVVSPLDNSLKPTASIPPTFNHNQSGPESPARDIVPPQSSTPAFASDKPTRVAIRVDRATIQKRMPTSTAGANSASLKNTLISAVEGGKHKIVEQLLNRGVPPDTGPEKNAVIIAVKHQDVESLKLLLEFGANPNSPDNRESTAISEACFLKEDLTKLLLDFGADPNLSARGWSPMTWVVDANKLNQAQLLLRYGADPNGMSKNGETNLYYAAGKGCASILHELLEWGADPNKTNSSRDTPLVAASKSRNFETVKILLAHGALPNISGPNWAPLPWIIDSEDAMVVRYFLEHGGDPNGFSENGENNMVYVVTHSIECVRALIDHGGNVNGKNKGNMTPLVAACKSRKFDVARLLIERGADPNLSSDPWAALPWVIDSGDEEMVRFMLHHGTDPNGKSRNGVINLFYGIEKPFTKLVELMLTHRGDLNQKDASGQTLLECACRCGRSDMIKVLLQNGVNPNQRGQNYPIFHCSGRPECLKLLLDAGADPKLHPGLIELATYKNEIEAVKMLLAYGVDVNEPHMNQFRALSTSIRDNHQEIFDVLMQAGANPNLKGDILPIEGALSKPRYLKPLLVAGAKVDSEPGILELAVWHNDMDSVRTLLDVAKVDINELRPRGHGAVTTAVRDDRFEILAELIARKADLNIETCDGLPIIMASKVEDQRKLRMLLDGGADVNKADRHRGYTALIEACAKGRMGNVQLLLKHGANAEKMSKTGDSAMDIAAREGHEEILMVLLEGME